MKKMCQKKCILDLKNPELNVGEKNCVDRCVYKYYEANEHLIKFFAEEKIGDS